MLRKEEAYIVRLTKGWIDLNMTIFDCGSKIVLLLVMKHKARTDVGVKSSQ